MTIFGIGGGEITRGETRPIDREILSSTGADDPQVLFVPTASGDADHDIDAVEAYFGDTLGCAVDVLGLVGTAQITADSAEKIGAADVIYVGGGDAGYMLEIWRTRGIDDLFREAWRNGTVLSGLGAGAICWFAGGLDDGVAVQHIDYGPIRGLEFVPRLHLTTHATPERREAFQRYLSVRGATGIALEDGTAIEITGDGWRLHKSRAAANAYLVPPAGRAGECEALPTDDEYRPMSVLK